MDHVFYKIFSVLMLHILRKNKNSKTNLVRGLSH